MKPAAALLPLVLFACAPADTVDPEVAPSVRTVETVAAGQDRPEGLAIRNQRIVWANTGKTKDDGTGAIMECRTLDCSDGPSVVWDGLAMPHDPMFAGDQLVWLGFATVNGAGEFGNHTLMSMPLDGSSVPWPMLWIGLSMDVGSAYADGRNVYFGTLEQDGYLGVCDASGCPESTTSFYVVSEGIAGASAIVHRPSEDAFYIAEPFTAALSRVDIDSGAIEPFETNQIAVFDLARNNTHLFWGTALPEDLEGDGIEIQNYLARKAFAGGPMEELAETAEVTAIAVEDGWVYFGEATGDVSRIPVDGGEVERLASGFERPSALLVHEGYLYWTDRSRDGGVYRVAL
ncbi:MAG: hypothetical protein H6737_06355 [Alphaproteobacteria bacterium]|nr:hypothetical protein [Alphaproteobacteria bacterium]